MIGSLRGKIIDVFPSHVLLDVGGIGFRLNAAIPLLTSAHAGDERMLYIHDHVREDARDLYAFATAEELTFFEKLISISGVGPKLALTILSIGSIESVRRAVMGGDIAFLTSVPGIGTKTAQKIVLELKGQLVDPTEGSHEDREVTEALVALGYSAQQARKAVADVGDEIEDTSERIRQALRYLS